MNECIFCRIINKEIPAQIIYEDDNVIAFHDLHPKAKTHYLVIPKKHIASMLEVNDTDTQLLGDLCVKVNDIAQDHHLEGYQMHINVGAKGGQEVFHLHIHLLSNA